MNTDTEQLSIAEQAAEWLVRLETASAQERAEFWNWLRESPLHVREALAAQACHLQLSQLFGGRRIDADAFVTLTNGAPEQQGTEGLPFEHDTSHLRSPFLKR